MKKLATCLIVLLSISCDTENQEINNQKSSNSFNIEYVDKNDNITNRTTNTVASTYELENLSSSCNLTSIGFQSFTNNVAFNDPTNFMSGLIANDMYGELPTSYLTRGLTQIFSNPNFLPMPSMSPGQINPVTGLPYYKTMVNNYYTEYNFTNYSNGVNPVTLEPTYLFLSDNISPTTSNQIRNLIACKLLQEANNIDPTAFILDIGVDNESLLCLDCNTRLLKVWVKWGYHR